MTWTSTWFFVSFYLYLWVFYLLFCDFAFVSGLCLCDLPLWSWFLLCRFVFETWPVVVDFPLYMCTVIYQVFRIVIESEHEIIFIVQIKLKMKFNYVFLSLPNQCSDKKSFIFFETIIKMIRKRIMNHLFFIKSLGHWWKWTFPFH